MVDAPEQRPSKFYFKYVLAVIGAACVSPPGSDAAKANKIISYLVVLQRPLKHRNEYDLSVCGFTLSEQCQLH
jgi:hypothetical protein